MFIISQQFKSGNFMSLNKGFLAVYGLSVIRILRLYM